MGDMRQRGTTGPGPSRLAGVQRNPTAQLHASGTGIHKAKVPPVPRLVGMVTMPTTPYIVILAAVRPQSAALPFKVSMSNIVGVPAPRPPYLKAELPRIAVLAGIWAVLVGLLIAAGEVVTHSAAITHFDHHTTRVVVSSRTAGLDSAMKVVTWLGSWVAVVVAAVIITLLVIRRRLPVLAAIVAVFAWAGEAGGVRIGKEVVGRDRPPEAIWLVRAHGWSFPSGHAAAACLVFTVLALCVVALTRHRVAWMLGWLTAGVGIAATAFSRVELGVHWMTDVIAGIVFVASWLTAIVILLGGRLRRPEPVVDRAGAPEPLPRQGESRG